MKTIEQLNGELDAKIPASEVSKRVGGGQREFSYLESHYVIARANKVLGNLNWASETVENKCILDRVVKDSRGNDRFQVGYVARVRIEVQHIDEKGQVMRTSHMGTGSGEGLDPNPVKAHESAAKEAESDAEKRAMRKLGMSMGLALYSKDQENVENDSAGKSLPANAGKAGPGSPATTSSTTTSPSSRPKLADAQPASNRPVLNGNINTASKIVVQMKKKSIDELKSMMREKYGTDDKEKLTDAQAQEFLAELNKLVS